MTSTSTIKNCTRTNTTHSMQGVAIRPNIAFNDTGALWANGTRFAYGSNLLFIDDAFGALTFCVNNGRLGERVRVFNWDTRGCDSHVVEFPVQPRFEVPKNDRNNLPETRTLDRHTLAKMGIEAGSTIALQRLLANGEAENAVTIVRVHSDLEERSSRRSL